MENETQPSDTAARIERINTEVPRVAVTKAVEPNVYEIPHPAERASILVAPAGFQEIAVHRAVSAFDLAQPQPARRKGYYIAADIASLIAWMEAHCTTIAPVFATGAENLAELWREPKLAFVGIGNYSDGFEAAWHDFGVQYKFPVTKAWTEWTASSNEWMSQSLFSEFVEKHLYEFSAPKENEQLNEAVTRMIEALGGHKQVASPSKMYELSNGIKITVAEQVEVQLDRASGEAVMKFTETHAGKGGRPVAIPKFFYIRLPIFFGEEPILIGALLRYRNQGGGSVMWSYELFAPDLIVKDAFEKACTVIRSFNRTLYMGSPDTPYPIFY